MEIITPTFYGFRLPARFNQLRFCRERETSAMGSKFRETQNPKLQSVCKFTCI